MTKNKDLVADIFIRLLNLCESIYKIQVWKRSNAEGILRDPKVINLITKSLVETTDNYFVGNCKWEDGIRSNMVLEPKNALSDFPPLIVENRHIINKAFIKRAVNCCLKAFKRYHSDPIILIICVEKLNRDSTHVKLSKLPDIQLMEYDKPLTLAYLLSQPQLEEAIDDAKSRTLTTKRKYEEPLTEEPSSTKKNPKCPTTNSINIHYRSWQK
ncbi:hypothetical protein BY458DRAFT_561218 [Sporodiniella umbellata]|nr:hypothetical protein BY458DRAFT_561218 [Sporodiniella umbellata]